LSDVGMALHNSYSALRAAKCDVQQNFRRGCHWAGKRGKFKSTDR
jgi:hypothetical protein